LRQRTSLPKVVVHEDQKALAGWQGLFIWDEPAAMANTFGLSFPGA
jgi:hypothetical protein